MNQLNVRHAFSMLPFQFTSSEIKAAMAKTITEIEAKIAERKERVLRIREEHQLTDKRLAELLVQLQNAPGIARAQTMSYGSPNESAEADDAPMLVGAGAVKVLTTEQGLIENEKQCVERLRMIARNVKPCLRYGVEGTPYTDGLFHLTMEEMEFLGL